MIYPSRARESYCLPYSPLALAYLGRHTPGHYRISVHDEYVGRAVDPGSLRCDIAAFSPLTPGISRAYELADALRTRGVTCVAGGPHVSALPDEALQHFDAVVIGEGERSWPDLLADFERGDLRRIYRLPPSERLDDLGTPRRDLIDRAYRFPSVITSRGCPHRCSYCYLSALGGGSYRTVPHDTVLEDLERLRDDRIIIIVDENFAGYGPDDFEDRKDLLTGMIRRGVRHVWGCQATAAISRDDELLRLMHRAGCRAVFIGFETVQRQGLIEIRKTHNVDLDYRSVVQRLHRRGLAVIASCILGLDTQDRAYPRLLVRALKDAQVDFTRVFYLTAWPGTPLFTRMEREGRASHDWDRVRKDVPSLVYRHFTAAELGKARDLVLRKMLGTGHLVRVVLRWLPREPSLIPLLVRTVREQRPKPAGEETCDNASTTSSPATGRWTACSSRAGPSSTLR